MGQSRENRDSIWQEIKCPGLSACAGDVFRLGRSIPRKLSAFHYKQARRLLWITLIGGTGTGKSTLFNALCGGTISQAGIERPKTSGPIVFAHEKAALEHEFPLQDVRIERISRLDLTTKSLSGTLGGEGVMVVVDHGEDALAHLVLVDTPDLDSLEVKNRRIVDDLMLLSDVILFVSSQEKYADEVPFQFFKRFYTEGRRYFFILNKAQPGFNRSEALEAFQNEGIPWREDQTFVLPYLSREPGRRLRETPEFASFYKTLTALFSDRNLPQLIEEARRRESAQISQDVRQLLECLRTEQTAAKKWIQGLHTAFQGACVRLSQQQQQERVTLESRQYIQKQIRKHFSRYDVLRGPRRFIADVVRAPLMFLGLVGERREESHEDALARIRDQIDLGPLEASLESFNREVLEKLSPQDPASPLFKSLRRPELILTREEIRELVRKEQDLLVAWLEETFRKMAEGIPKSKQLGIHSMSILWGAVIITLETLVMGGITLLEAVLNSALAPFITKGAVEIFADQELKKVARDLRQRYHDGLVSVLNHQRLRYETCVQGLLMDDQALKELEQTLSSLDS